MRGESAIAHLGVAGSGGAGKERIVGEQRRSV